MCLKEPAATEYWQRYDDSMFWCYEDVWQIKLQLPVSMIVVALYTTPIIVVAASAAIVSDILIEVQHFIFVVIFSVFSFDRIVLFGLHSI